VAALLKIGLVNAVVATLLACVVALIARRVRRPALIHALWIIVLAKLITPPLFEIPIEVPFEVPGIMASVEEQRQTPAGDLGSSTVASRDPSHDSKTAADREIATVDSRTGSHSVGAVAAAAQADSQTLMSWAGEVVLNIFRWLARHPASVLAGIWVIGGLAWYLLQAFTAYKFSQRLALAIPAPAEIQREADKLAAAMGLAYRPPVLIVRDVISPMLWGIGRNTRLLFPFNLLNRIDNGARATLVAHELAHYRRGDHWVRAFELVVSGLFWWHPVVWWARRQIEIAEEECCDAWVIEQFPDTPRWYAEALLETLDFLAEAALVLPPAAAGAGHVPFLRQRLIAIMRGVAPQKMTLRTWCAVFVMALATLPWHPGLVTARSQIAADAADPASDIVQNDDGAIDRSAANARLEEISQSRQAELIQAHDAFSVPGPVPAPADQPWARATSPGGRYFVNRRGGEDVDFYIALANPRIDMSEQAPADIPHICANCLAISPDGRWLAIGTGSWMNEVGGQIVIWELPSMEFIEFSCLPRNQDAIAAAQFSRCVRSDSATVCIEPTDADRLRHIREEIDALERDLGPVESMPGFDRSNRAVTR
jgi:beta-lactamase regulating signal transducer with metallopeptidase domain